MVVEYDEARLGASDICLAVERTGYGCTARMPQVERIRSVAQTDASAATCSQAGAQRCDMQASQAGAQRDAQANAQVRVQANAQANAHAHTQEPVAQIAPNA